MGPSHDDDNEFLHSIIREDTQHEGPFEGDAPEYDGSEYLNDTGDDNADQQEEMTMEDIGAEVYGIRAYIYIYIHDLNSLCMYSMY